MVTQLHTFAATEETQGISALGLDPLAILAQAVTFLVLFFIIKKFALNKIVTTLEDRRKTIDKGVRLGIEMQAEKDKLDEAVEARLQDARLEADKILAGAHQEAGTIVNDAETKAVHKVDTMLADAQARTEDEVRRAKRELEKEMVSLVADATEIILGEKLDAKRDDALIKQELSGVEKS